MSLYLDHFGFAEAPFRITPHTGFFFTGGKRGQTLEALVYAITEDEGIVKVVGEVGSGKTTLCRMLLVTLPERVDTLYLANPLLSRQEILAAIAAELGLPDSDIPAHSRIRALQQALIERYAGGRRVVLLIDEAHAMPAESLEEIRLLSNLEADGNKLLQIALFAQPELDERLAADDLRQLRERVTQQFALAPLQRPDVASYIEFRLRRAGYRGPNPFDDQAITLIHEHSLGLSRRINILADKALLAAFSEGRHEVGRKEVRTAVADAHFAPLKQASSASLRLPLMVAALVAVALAIGLGVGWQSRSPATAEALPAARPAPAATPAPAASPVVAPAPASETPQLDRALAALPVWLAKARRADFFIQLYTTDGDKAGEAEKFLARFAPALDSQALRAYHSDRSGRDRIGLVYGQYDNRAAAASAIASLPPALRALKPYPRQVERLHQ